MKNLPPKLEITEGPEEGLELYDLDAIEKLWRDYRDEEKNQFTEEEWTAYRTMFRRFVNFPDWLRKNTGVLPRKREALAEAETPFKRATRQFEGLAGGNEEDTPHTLTWAQKMVIDAIRHLGVDTYGTTLHKHLQEMLKVDIHYPLLMKRVEELKDLGLVVSEKRGNGRTYFWFTEEGVRISGRDFSVPE